MPLQTYYIQISESVILTPGLSIYSPSSKETCICLCVFPRTHKLGCDVKLCLRRMRRGRGGQRQRSRQRSRCHNRKASSSISQQSTSLKDDTILLQGEKRVHADCCHTVDSRPLDAVKKTNCTTFLSINVTMTSSSPKLLAGL